MDQHVQAVSAYPSDCGEATEKTNETALDQSPETFLTSLFDRRIYDIRATENAAIGLFDRTPHPWPNTSVTGSDTHYAGALFEVNTVEVARDQFRRTKERWTGQTAVVLDDVGSKAKRPPVLPTAIIETRPGNEQWVYAFNRIERDRTLIETILQSAIAGGITDPEAGGITRITRLPGSLPTGKTHRAKLIWADWSRRFNPDALIEQGFQVARVKPTSPSPVGELRLSDETTEEGRNALERACQTIRFADPGTIANTINAQSFFIGQSVGAGEIALADAEAGLFAAASTHERGVGHARNGLAAGMLKPLARQANGRFTGQGAERAEQSNVVPLFEELAPARAKIRTTLERFVEQALNYRACKTTLEKHAAAAERFEQGKRKSEPEALAAEIIETAMASPPVLALAATPGAGKSGTALDVLAKTDFSALGGDVVFFAPTLALSEQAAADFQAKTGLPAHVTRGRSAKIPGTDAPMCARADLAQKVAAAGLPVKTTLCESKDAGGNKRRCPHFHSCAYLRQWDELPTDPVVRFEATAYLSLPGDGSGRETGLRIIDETIWQQATRQTDLSFDVWTAPRSGGDPFTSVDATDAAIGVLSALQAGESIIGGKYGAEDFRDFKAAETVPINLGRCTPDSPDGDFIRHLDAHNALGKNGSRMAGLWAILEDCAERGIENTERVRIVETKDGPRIRFSWFRAPPANVPTLLLDADITAPILERLYPGAELVTVDLKPNAHVVQLTDRTFSNKTLERVSVRRELVRLVQAEVMRDAEGKGVLCIATRKAVRAMFEDAGHDFEGKDPRDVSELMLNTPLHGARWIWFGPASLGRNDWENFGTAIEIGREDIGLDPLEDLARAFFGDSETPLTFVEPDEKGLRILPAAKLPVTMGNGEAWLINARAHPDAQVRALQVQTRERAARQGIERLRLVNATTRKRVLICTTVPVPGLPVSELRRWDQIAPSRLKAAIAEAAQAGGVLRLSASGLCADAPNEFPTVKAAEQWLTKEGKAEIEKITPLTGNKILLAGRGVIFSKLRVDARGARATYAIVIGQNPRAVAEAALGPLSLFEAETEAIKQTDGVKTPDRGEPKKRDDPEIVPDIAKPERRRRAGT